MQGYIISLRKDNYENIKDSNYSLVGFTEHCKIADRLQPGDILLMYIASGVSKFAGILTVKEPFYWDSELLWDDIFPKRVKTEPLVLLEKEKWVDVRMIKDNLSFISNKENKKFGVYFMQGIRTLPVSDLNYIIEEINKRK